jgi:uncharacterized protein
MSVPMDVPKSVQVTVAYVAPGIEALVPLTLPERSTLADAVARSGIVARHALDPATLVLAVFGRRADPATPLANGDRVEITRPLVVDAKAARRARAAAKPHRPS